MRFHFKGFAIFVASMATVSCFGQYEGQDSLENKETTKSEDLYTENPLHKLSLFKAVEISTLPIQIYGSFSIDPQIAYWWNKRFMLGVGSQIGLSQKFGLSTGGFGFGRVNINRIFLQGEYRLLYVSSAKKWVRSPIFLIGYMADERMNQWISVGIAQNPNFQQYSPYGFFVYRIGFKF